MTDVTFQRAPLSALLWSAVEDDLKGRATASQVAMLRERGNLVTWARILSRIEQATENHIAKDKLAVKSRQPQGPPTPEWLAEKSALSGRNVARYHFLDVVRAKRLEVASLVSTEGLTTHTLGTVCDSLVEVERLMDERQHDGAHDLLSAIIGRFERDGA